MTTSAIYLLLLVSLVLLLHYYCKNERLKFKAMFKDEVCISHKENNECKKTITFSAHHESVDMNSMILLHASQTNFVDLRS